MFSDIVKSETCMKKTVFNQKNSFNEAEVGFRLQLPVQEMVKGRFHLFFHLEHL